MSQSKYVFPKGINEYWNLLKCIKNQIEKIQISEYSAEKCLTTTIMIDDEKPSKSDEFLYVNHHYSLEEETKLGIKSLLYRYYQTKIQENMYLEEFSQLNAMATLLNELLSSDNIQVTLSDFNSKTLLKLLNATFIKDEFMTSSSDYSYEETIMIQLKMIDYIAQNTSKRFFVFVDIPKLTYQIRDLIKNIVSCYIIVISFQSEEMTFDDNNLFIYDIDFENDELIYERMMEMDEFYHVNEYKDYMKNVYLKSISK